MVFLYDELSIRLVHHLAYTETPVTYVAFDCGFGSFSTFSRIFKKQNGCTPSDYRDRKKSELSLEEI